MVLDQPFEKSAQAQADHDELMEAHADWVGLHDIALATAKRKAKSTVGVPFSDLARARDSLSTVT